jgi:hypothetical protein
VAFIFLFMLAMIVGSIVVELILPQAFKDRVGTAVCWSMMGVTMAFLILATIGLIVATYYRFVTSSVGA